MHTDSIPGRLLCSSQSLSRLAANGGLAAGRRLTASRVPSAGRRFPADTPRVLHCPFCSVLHTTSAKRS